MLNKDIDIFFQKAGIKTTPVRILVYKSLKESNNPISLSEIELLLESVDKSTISRTLNTFKKHHLIHTINDGSGSMKYELCKEIETGQHDDLHVHFHCESCGILTCFTSLSIPEVKLPEGYEVHDTSYVITGICANCSK